MATELEKPLSMDEQTPAQVLIGGDDPELAKPSESSGSFYKFVRKMRNHPTVSLSRQLCVAPLLAADWSIQEVGDAPPDAKEFFEKTLLPLKFHLLRTSLYGCLDFGWQPYEKVGKIDESTGLIAINKIKPLLQDDTTIQIDIKTGAFNGFKNKEIIIELQDALLLNIEVEGTNWYGEPVSLVTKKPYDEWQFTNDANVRYDKKLAGAHWVIKYPQGKSTVSGAVQDNSVTAAQIMAGLQSSGQVCIPKKTQQIIDDVAGADNAWEIELLSAYPTSNVAFLDRLKYLDSMMARSYGLPERAVLEGQFGTKAEAEAHADFALTNMELRHQMMVLQYNWHLVNQLLRLNWGPEFENTIKISVAPITDVTLSFLRQVYQTHLANPTGFATEQMGTDLDELRDKLGVPASSEQQISQKVLTEPTATGLSFLNGLDLGKD